VRRLFDRRLYPGASKPSAGRADRIAFVRKELVSADMYVAFSKQSKCAGLKAAFGAEIDARRQRHGGEVLERRSREVGESGRSSTVLVTAFFFPSPLVERVRANVSERAGEGPAILNADPHRLVLAIAPP